MFLLKSLDLTQFPVGLSFKNFQPEIEI